MSVEELDAEVAAKMQMGHFGAAIPVQETRLAKTSPDDWASLATARLKLALLLGEAGEAHRALPLYRESIRALEGLRSEEAWMLCEAVSSYGLALMATGEAARALEVFGRGRDIARDSGQKAWESQFLLERGKVLVAADEPTSALEALEAARTLREPLGDRGALVEIALCIGISQESLGKEKEARAAYENVLVCANAPAPAGGAAEQGAHQHDSLDAFAREKRLATEALARLKAASLRSRLSLDL
jgi:hypothetical protein